MILNLIYRTLIIYFTVLIVMRLMGKREVGQLSIFDLVVAIMIAEIAVFPLGNASKPLYLGLVPMFVLVGTEIFLSYLCLRSRFLREVIEGQPSVIIANGKIMEKEMRRLRYNINDLLGQLREKNIFNICDVEYAILETSGKLSVVVKPAKRVVTMEDFNFSPSSSESLPVPLIVDGELLSKNLEHIGYSQRWLEEKLRDNNLKIKEILYASLDNQGRLYISEKEKKRKEKKTCSNA